MSVMMITALYNVSGILTSKKRGCAWGATSFYRFIGVSALFDNSLLAVLHQVDTLAQTVAALTSIAYLDTAHVVELTVECSVCIAVVGHLSDAERSLVSDEPDTEQSNVATIFAFHTSEVNDIVRLLVECHLSNTSYTIG